MHQARGRIGTAILAVAVIIATSVVQVAQAGGAEPIAAPLERVGAPEIELTPIGPYAPGDAVTVTVTNLDPDTYYTVAQCPTGSREHCGLLTGLYGSRTQLVLRRTIVGNGVATDCGVQPCEIAFIDGDEIVQALAAAVEIDVTSPIVPPSVVLTPGTALADNEVISISGTGFAMYSEYLIAQCAGFTCSDQTTYAYSDDVGTLEPVGFVARRTINGFDCALAVAACAIWVSADGHLDELAIAAIDFDPNRQPLPNPSATADPQTGLLDGDTVAVTVENTRSAPAFVRQCVVDEPDQCLWSAGASDDTASDTKRLDIEVGRRIGSTDCAIDRCVLAIEVPPFPSLQVPIGFDVSVPPPDPPTLSVQPDRGLADLQVVRLELERLGRNDAYVSLNLCTAAPADRRCTSIGQWSVEGAAFTVDVGLPRLITDGRGNAIDCAAVQCAVVAYVEGSGLAQELTAAVNFDPKTPLAPAPTVRALPASGLWDRQSVVLRGEHFRPDAMYAEVRQCATRDVIDRAKCGTPKFLGERLSPTGELSARFEVRRQLMTDDGGEFNCALVKCSLVVTTQNTVSFAAIEFTASGTVDAFPDQLECVAWPTNGWPKGALPDGVDRADLDDIAARSAANPTAWQSFVVIHGGKVVYEWYDAGTNAATIRPSFSVSKSITATMAGLLIDDGLLSLDGPAPVPEWSDPGDPRHAISLRNLLNMASGLEWDESYSFADDTDIIQMLASADTGGYVANKPLVAPPGTEHRYSTGTTTLIARIMAQATGKSGPAFRALMDERLFNPLGISNVEVQFDQIGTWFGGGGTNMATRDFAKLGLLYLRDGVWEDEQLLPDGWAEYVRTPAPTNSGYGAQFWIRDSGRFEMIGLYGQSVLIAPDLDLVVAVANSGASTYEVASLFEAAATPSCGDADALALDDSIVVAPGSTTTIDVLANDPGAGEMMAPETLTIADAPWSGIASVAQGAVVYTAANTAGHDEFTYVACNASRRCAEATVRIDVTSTTALGPFVAGGSVDQFARRCSLRGC